MSLREEELRFIRQHSKTAIDYAMLGEWEKAVDENKIILESYPNDIDSLNRLGRAYMELARFDESTEVYLRAKELDPFNTIAEKNLIKLETLKKEDKKVNLKAGHIDPRFFIEETGKAANVRVVILAAKDVLATLTPGEAVDLVPNGKHLEVRNDKELIGWVEPKIEKRLLPLIEGGNKYKAYISSASLTDMTIIIRETYQDPSQFGIMSFLTKGIELDSNSLNGGSSDDLSDIDDGSLDDDGAELSDDDDEAEIDEDDDLDEDEDKDDLTEEV